MGKAADYIPEGMSRAAAPDLPEMSQYQVLRHYLRYSQKTLGMDLGSDISEGTCTMKYSPKMHEELIRRHQAADVHPWQDEETMQGLLEIVYDRAIPESISGMDAFTLQPGGGSHAVYTNACVMRAYFEAKGELDQRNEIITTIFSHPCDAATPMVAGFKVITVMPDENGYPDLEAFSAAVSEKTVGFMITNPEDTGIYNPQIDKYVDILHEAGALAFTDQANANGILGYRARARRRLRRLPLQPAQDVLEPARLRGSGHRRLPVHRRTGAVPARPHGHQGRRPLPPRLRPPREHRQGARVPRQLDGRHPRLRLDPQHGPRGPQGGRRDQRPQQQLPGQPADGGQGREPAVCRRPPPARPGALQPGAAEGRYRRRHRGVARPHGRLRHPELLDEPPPVGGARPFTPEPCETYSKDDLDEWAAVIKKGSDEAYADPQFVLDSPHVQPIDQMRRTEAMEDPQEWAFTWRAYKKKILKQE